jgi:hypothetical protein
MVGVPEPEVLASVTVLPETGELAPLSNVTVIVEVVVPSAVTVEGEGDTVDNPAETAAAVNVTVAVCVICRLESVVSVAVNTGEPAVEDFTVKVTTPVELEVPEAAEIVSVAPRLEASVTVLPDTGLLWASFNVTVIVEVLTPSAATDEGEGATVDCAAVTAPAVNVTVAVAVTVTLSEVSVAVKTSAAAVVDATVKVA